MGYSSLPHNKNDPPSFPSLTFPFLEFSAPPPREKFPYSELFWSVFFRIQTEYGPNARKYGPE